MAGRTSAALFFVALMGCGEARALTLYRVELKGGGVVFAESKPEAEGATLVFRSSPQGILVALRASGVARVVPIDSLDKAPLDLGGAVVRSPAFTGGAAPPPVPLESTAPTAPPPAPRRYAPGDDQPGNRVAFPVSRDDLLPGNYRPYPAGPGGQTAPLPLLADGAATPKAGLLAEPPHAIVVEDPPCTLNRSVSPPGLAFAEYPRVDDQTPKAAAKLDVPF